MGDDSIVAKTESEYGYDVQNPPNPKVKVETSLGEFEGELFLKEMPVTVSNWIDLARSGFYNGVAWHRVIPNFMDQTGCPFSKDGAQGRPGTGNADADTTYVILAGKQAGQVVKRNSMGGI